MPKFCKLVFVVFCFTSPWSGSLCAATYTITDLGDLGGESVSFARRINDIGQITGTANISYDPIIYHAFLYDNGVMIDITPGVERSSGQGINNLGQVVGVADSYPFLFSNEQIINLNNLAGFSAFEATDINDKGQILGSQTVSNTVYACMYDYHNATFTTLGTLPGSDRSYGEGGINNRGQIVGIACYLAYPTYHSFLYDNGTMQDLGTLYPMGLTTPSDINSKGQVTGESGSHAFLYSNGQMIDLGVLPGYTYESGGDGINDLGQVVGASTRANDYASHGFLYSNGTMTDLNSMIDPNAGWVIEYAASINKSGCIAGYGLNPKGQRHAYVLTPLRPPGTLAVVRISGTGAGCTNIADSVRFTFGYCPGGSAPTHGIFNQLPLTTKDVGGVFSIGSNDTNFAFLVSILTNGNSDFVGDLIEVGPCGFSESKQEAHYFSPLPSGGNYIDFAGFHIDNFALQVEKLTFTPSGAWTEAAWSFLLCVNSEPWSLPAIWASPGNQTADVGSAVDFIVRAVGTPPLAYQWFFNGSAIQGATGTDLRLTDLQLPQAGAYTVVVTNASGAVTSQPAILTVAGVPPIILEPPLSQTATAGGFADFSVTAAGSPPLTYQWFFNGGSIQGATGTGLHLANLQLSQSGNYAVVITNTFGAVTSAPASLTVIPAQNFVNLDFEDGTLVFTGDGGVLFSEAFPGWAGGGSLTLYNGGFLDIPGIAIIDTNYSNLPAGVVHGRFCVLVQAGEMGGWGPGYYVASSISQVGTIPTAAKSLLFNAVVWTNSMAPGSPLELTFDGTSITWMVVTNYPNYLLLGADVSAFAGQTGELKFTAPPLLWGHNSFFLDYIRFSDLPLTVPPAIQLGPVASQVGSTVDIAIYATGSAPLVYQWFFNSTNVIQGATNSILELTNVRFSQSGEAYSVVITNLYGAVTSPPAILAIQDPFILVDPASQSVDAKQNASFSVGAGGTEPLAFQWTKNGASLSDGGNVFGATTSTLIVSNVLGGDAGRYSVRVSNDHGTVTSQAADLTVRDPVIVSQPVSQTVDRGGTAVLNVVAAGTAPFSYQWFDAGSRLSDDQNVSGAQTAALTVANVFRADADAYWVVLSGSYGSVTSTVAVLDVNPPTYSVLHNFQGSDGAGPGSLILSGATLYGASSGSSGYGALFAVNIDGTGYRILKNFNGVDGSISGGVGLELSGSTLFGAGTLPNNRDGMLFKINVDGNGYSVFKEFHFTDGSSPAGLRVFGTTVYGTTSQGGSGIQGTVFRIGTDGSGYTALKSFIGGSDGGQPMGNLALSSATLYGTTLNSYPTGGEVFKLNTDGTGFAVLKHFDATGANGPYAGVVSSGLTLYGTTGSNPYNSSGSGCGAVFKVNTDGSGFALLRNFAGGSDGQMGVSSTAHLLVSGAMLYGTTEYGGMSNGLYGNTDYAGRSNCGTVFQIDTSGNNYAVIKRFRGSDGAHPTSLLQSGSTLYGTAWEGGSSGDGVVFALSLPIPEILTPPVSQTVETGASVCFHQQITGDSPMGYVWFFNGTNVCNSGKGNADLRLTNVGPSQAGVYTVVVTNVFGAVTSAPVTLSVIPAVERRWLPWITLIGQPGSALNLETADALGPAPNWAAFDTVVLTNVAQEYFDLTAPPSGQHFYRARLSGGSRTVPMLDIHTVPALTLTGAIGSTVRVDAINRFGPTDAWFPLATVTLTNTSQLYFDVSAPGQPQRLYRLIQVP